MRSGFRFLPGLCLCLLPACSRSPQHPAFHETDFWPFPKTAYLARALANQTNAVWGTGTHTAAPVPLGALGPEKYLKQLRGVIQNTRIADVTRQAVNDGVSVILIIGDGMGVMHLSLPMYLNVAKKNGRTTYLETILNEGATGLCLTNAADELVTCSAASGTAFACGTKTRQGILGLDSNGYPVESVLEGAAEKGMATGLITDTRVTHATPAAFYAKCVNRDLEGEIALQAVQRHRINVLLGGGAAFFIARGTMASAHPLLRGLAKPLDAASERKDSLDLLGVLAAGGYAVAANRNELDRLPDTVRHVIGLFAGGAMNAPIDRDDEETGEPSVDRMTEKALTLLSREKKGFFLMSECGQIDWASHGNDAGAVVKAMEEMDRVLRVCYGFAKARPGKVLLMFTADHETGGLGFSYSYADPPPSKTLPGGQVWTSDINGLSFSQFLKLEGQKKSLAGIAAGAPTAAALKAAVEANSPFTISDQDARAVRSLK